MATLKPNTTDNELNKKFHRALGKCLAGDDCECIPHDYLNDLASAFELVEWMRKEKLWWVELSAGWKDWYVRITHDEGNALTTDESLPKAISLACAKALGVEI